MLIRFCLCILQKEDVVYFNAKDTMKALDSNLTYDPHFKQEVSFNYSSVHIPVEIYDGGRLDLVGLNIYSLFVQFSLRKID